MVQSIFVRDREFYTKVLCIGLPIAAQSLITVGINLTDTLMLGALGEVQISASSLANQFIGLFQILCMGIGMGASVLVSRFWGAQDTAALRKSITIMFRACLGLCVVFVVVTLVSPGMVMQIYTNDAAIVAEGAKYLSWLVPTYVFMGISLMCTLTLRSVGAVFVPMISSACAFAVNYIVNYTFIFGNLGAPRMEIEGAALGTLLSRAFECLVIAIYFFSADKRIGYRLKHLFGKCADLMGPYVRISLPVLTSDALLAVGNSAIAMVMGRIGAYYVAANAIVAVLQQLSTIVTQGVSQASAIITGHTIGQGDVAKAKKQGYTFLAIGILLGLVGCAAVILLRRWVVGFFNVQPKTAAAAEQMILVLGFILIFQSVNFMLTKGVLRGGGDTRFLMFGDIFFLWLFSIPLGAWAGLVARAAPYVVYFFLRIDQIANAIWCVTRLISGRWVKSIASPGLRRG